MNILIMIHNVHLCSKVCTSLVAFNYLVERQHKQSNNQNQNILWWSKMHCDKKKKRKIKRCTWLWNVMIVVCKTIIVNHHLNQTLTNHCWNYSKPNKIATINNLFYWSFQQQIKIVYGAFSNTLMKNHIQKNKRKCLLLFQRVY